MFKYICFMYGVCLLAACKIACYESVYYEKYEKIWDNANQVYTTVPTKYKQRYSLLVGNGTGRNKYVQIESPIGFGGEKYPRINIYGRLKNKKILHVPFNAGFWSVTECDSLLLDTVFSTSPFYFPELYEQEAGMVQCKNYATDLRYFPLDIPELYNSADSARFVAPCQDSVFRNDGEPIFFYITINPHRADSFIFYPKVFHSTNVSLPLEQLQEFMYDFYRKTGCSGAKRTQIRDTIYPTDTIEWFKVTTCKSYRCLMIIDATDYCLPAGEYFYKPQKKTGSFFKGQLVANMSIFAAFKDIHIDTTISNLRIQKHLFGRLTLLYDKEQQTHKIRFKPIFIRPRYRKSYRNIINYIQKNTELYETYQAQQLEYKQLMQTKKRP